MKQRKIKKRIRRKGSFNSELKKQKQKQKWIVQHQHIEVTSCK